MTLFRSKPIGAAPQRCHLCGRATVTGAVSFDDMAVGVCSSCGSGMVCGQGNGRPGAVEAEDYSARYERERTSGKPTMCWTQLQRRTAGLSGVRNVLDIGCGQGGFLDLARRAGLDTAGVEISRRAAAIAAAKGHRVFCRSVLDGPITEGERFDLVVMWDVLEHLPDPGQALRRAREVLAPGGRLFITTPMMGSVYDRYGVILHRLSRGSASQLLRMCWSRDHLFRFHPAGLSRTLRALGFDPVKAEPWLQLSLEPEYYAGGSVLKSWTGRPRLDGLISRFGVAAAKALQLHNKVLIEAQRGTN